MIFGICIINKLLKTFWNVVFFQVFNKTIRLFTFDFYEVIVDSGFALINYHQKEIMSE
jgi:hypothetical protein